MLTQGSYIHSGAVPSFVIDSPSDILYFDVRELMSFTLLRHQMALLSHRGTLSSGFK